MIRVQSIAGTNLLGASANIVSGTFPNVNTTGNAIIVGLSYDAAAGGCSGISDLAGNSYTKVQASSRRGCEIWLAQNILQGTNNVVTGTLNFVDGQIFCDEWSGLQLSGAFDVGAAGTGLGTSPFSPATPSPTYLNEMVYTVLEDDSNIGTYNVAGGFSNLISGTSAFSSGASASKIISSPTVQQGTFLGGVASNTYDCVVATFKAKPSGFKNLLGIG